MRRNSMTPISGFNTAANTAQSWIYRARRPLENNLEAIRNLIAETRELIQKNEIGRIDGLSIWKIQESYELIATTIQLIRDGFEVDEHQIEKLKQDIRYLSECPFTNTFKHKTISDLPKPFSRLAKFYTQLRHLYLQELSDIPGRPVQIPTPQPATSAATPLPTRLFYENVPEVRIPLEQPRPIRRIPNEGYLWDQTQGYSMLSGRTGAVSEHIFQASDHSLPKMCGQQTRNKATQEQGRINRTQDVVLEDLHNAIDKLISQTQKLVQKLDLDMIEYLSIWKIQENYELIAAIIKLIQEGFQLDEEQIDKLVQDTLSLAEHPLTKIPSCDLPTVLSHLEELYAQLRDLYLKELYNI